jgi:hypothetical protein
VKRAMLAIEVHRHRRRPPSIVAEYMAGSTLPQLIEPYQQDANWRAKVACPLGYTKLLFATTAAGGRDGWRLCENARQSRSYAFRWVDRKG